MQEDPTAGAIYSATNDGVLRKIWRESMQFMKGAAHRRRSLRTLNNAISGELVVPTNVHFQLGGQISRKMFKHVIDCHDVNYLLDDLDIHVCDRGEIFDVLDAD